MSFVLCRPTTFYRRSYERCPTCECITEMVTAYQEWYAPDVYCCRCGDGWGEDGRHERPWARGWRGDAVRRARRLWDVATYGRAPSLADFRSAS